MQNKKQSPNLKPNKQQVRSAYKSAREFEAQSFIDDQRPTTTIINHPELQYQFYTDMGRQSPREYDVRPTNGAHLRRGLLPELGLYNDEED